MREFVFALEYESGCNSVADTLATYPDTTLRSLACHVSSESLWRVDRATGSPEALDALEEAFLNAEYFSDCLITEDCGADSETQILDRTDDALILYTYWERTSVCTSVPHLALEYLGDGLLFDTQREGRRYTWRIILANEANVHAFFTALQEEVGDCAGMEMLRLTELSPSPTSQSPSDETLSSEQRDALRAATEHGYYETPRQIDLSELADQLDIPRSTLSYRLQRAEAELAKHFVGTGNPLNAESLSSSL